MVKVAIVGSRDFNSYDYLCDVMDRLNANGNIEQVICGCAKGADSLGAKWAKERDIPIRNCKPLWDKFGKKAGFIRNEDMAHFCDAVVAFWDGSSRGTKHMIEYSKKLGKDVRIY